MDAQTAAGAATGAGTDGDLLALFAEAGNETAFAEIVRRHESMVFNACLRTLRQHSDAEDAMQAVFLALSHKARDRALHRRPSLAAWLYEAAWHVSVRMRESTGVRRRREAEAAKMQDEVARAAEQWAQVAPLLDSELNELPEKYRLPIILHHLEQHSVEETAAIIRCSTEAAKQRLCRGREKLKLRLTQRGVVVSSAAMATLLGTKASAAAVGATFAGATAKTAALVIAGKAAGTAGAALGKAVAAATTRAILIRRLWWPTLIASILLVTSASVFVAAWMLSGAPEVAAAPTPALEQPPTKTIPTARSKGDYKTMPAWPPPDENSKDAKKPEDLVPEEKWAEKQAPRVQKIDDSLVKERPPASVPSPAAIKAK